MSTPLLHTLEPSPEPSPEPTPTLQPITCKCGFKGLPQDFTRYSEKTGFGRCKTCTQAYIKDWRKKQRKVILPAHLRVLDGTSQAGPDFNDPLHSDDPLRLRPGPKPASRIGLYEYLATLESHIDTLRGQLATLQGKPAPAPLDLLVGADASPGRPARMPARPHDYAGPYVENDPRLAPGYVRPKPPKPLKTARALPEDLPPAATPAPSPTPMRAYAPHTTHAPNLPSDGAPSASPASPASPPPDDFKDDFKDSDGAARVEPGPVLKDGAGISHALPDLSSALSQRERDLNSKRMDDNFDDVGL